MMRWQMIRENWAVYLAITACGLFVAIAAIGSVMVDTEPQPLEPGIASPKWEPTLPPAPEPDPRIDPDTGDLKPITEDEFDQLKNELRDEPPAPESSDSDSPCECTPTCPCDANHCTCQGKERCSDVCPCHKVVAKFWCPKCQRNGYCDMEPDEHPHRVCRDCKLWMDRVEPPMSAQEGYDVIVWRRVQQKMQAEKAAQAKRAKQRSSMPVYDPFDEDMPSWRPRRFYFNSTQAPANCQT